MNYDGESTTSVEATFENKNAYHKIIYFKYWLNPHACVKLEEMDRRTYYKVNNSPAQMTSLSVRFKSK